MNLRQLEAFRATIETGSITGAAGVLYISQPSVSRLISDLERSVCFPLFRRSGRRVVPTVEAQRFYQAVESMFIGVDRLKELADTIRTTAGGVITLGVIPALSQIVMPEAVGALRKNRPDMRMMIYTRNTPAIVDAVRMQQFDLGIVGRYPPYQGVQVLHQRSVPYVCLLPNSHKLARKKTPLDLEQIADSETFVTFGGAYPDEMLRMDHKLSTKLQRNSPLSAANMPIAASLVATTGALALVDPHTAKIYRNLGDVAVRTLKQELIYHVAVVTKGIDTLSAEATEFADKFIEQYDASLE